MNPAVGDVWFWHGFERWRVIAVTEYEGKKQGRTQTCVTCLVLHNSQLRCLRLDNWDKIMDAERHPRRSAFTIFKEGIG